jgi:hypothetical protein
VCGEFYISITVEEIIDDCREFKLKVKSEEGDLELSVVCCVGVKIQCDNILIKSSMEEFLLYRETLYSVSMQYSESCG